MGPNSQENDDKDTSDKDTDNTDTRPANEQLGDVSWDDSHKWSWSYVDPDHGHL